MLSQTEQSLIAEHLKLGKPPIFLAKDLKLPYAEVYRFAKSIGWNITWRDASFCKTTGGPSKLKIPVDVILSRYDNGEKQTEIAKDAGCSREYIRQLVERSGRVPCQAKKKAAREKREAIELVERKKRREALVSARLARDTERWSKARQMWAEDATIEQIALAYDLPSNSLAWHIHRMRQRHGWFPFRGAGYHQRLRHDPSLSEDKEKLELDIARQMWDDNKKVREIAEVYKTSTDAMGWRMWHARKNFGWFPKRKTT